MMARKRMGGILLGGWLLIGGLTGCSHTSQYDIAAVTDNAPPEQSLSLALADEVPTLDSAKATDELAFTLLTQTNEGLVRLDEAGKVVPGVAREWTISEDGLRYQFVLRENALWSDGSPVTAHDFEYAWKRALQKDTGSQYAFLMEWIKGGAEYRHEQAPLDNVSVIARDERTLDVELAAPKPYFLEQLSFPVFFPQQKEFVEKAGDRYGGDPGTVLANGPFKLAEWHHDQSLGLVKNDTYWDRGQVRLEQVEYQIIKDATAREDLYLAGVIDRTALVRDQIARYRGNPEYMEIDELVNGYLQFNQKHPVLQNAKIRKALTYAVNGDAYAEVVYQNGTRGATGLVPTGTSNGQGGDFRKDGGDLINRLENGKQAKALLEAGLRELGLAEFPKLKVLGDDGDTGKKSTQFLQEEWRTKLGIEIEVENVPFKLRLQRTAERDFDIVESLWGADYNDPMTYLDMWVTGSDFNESGYSNARYDDLVGQAKVEADAARRMQLLLDAERLLLDDMAVGPLFFRSSAVLQKPYVKKVIHRNFGPRYDLKYAYVEGR